ncbi:hypothetical protein [Methylophaga sp. UBA678]|uniref:hypothetical protein n=1 Tax=Methylophaga sp. UBA678 TaxID=1946901 RepID=UPI00259CC5E3|nr:hypothetical protein [Methylophaga sp. UBA678]|tara:strand:- start:4932 stop:5096 length:165 start_codon:yes stop_codon:yes gene_type:complete
MMENRTLLKIMRLIKPAMSGMDATNQTLTNHDPDKLPLLVSTDGESWIAFLPRL